MLSATVTAAFETRERRLALRSSSRAVGGLFGGLRLEQPDQKSLDDVMSRRSSDEQTQAINHLKSLVLMWSDQIDVSLRYSQAEHAKYTCDNSSSNDEDSSVDHLLKSPIFELEYWRHRTQVRKYIFFLLFFYLSIKMIHFERSLFDIYSY